MNSLLELMNKEFSKLEIDNSKIKYKKENIKGIEDFISDDKACADIIKYLLKTDFIEYPDKKDEIYDVAQGRARHSLINYLLGCIFKPFGSLYQSFYMLVDHNNIDKNESKIIWLLTALYHDIGYFLKALSDKDYNYRNNFTYYLYEDSDQITDPTYSFADTHSDSLAYTYDEIEEYDIFNRQQRENWGGIEKVNHGILGGAYIFNKTMKKFSTKASYSSREIIRSKVFSLAIGQHNIFKSDKVEDDHRLPPLLINKLSSDSDYRIDSSTPLLLFLSLVDTIECTKKFSKKENDKHSLQTLTVLKSIDIDVTSEKVIVDYSRLREHISTRDDANDLCEVLENYEKNVVELGNWTSFQISKIKEDNYEICMN